MRMTDVFSVKAPKVMADLMRDFSMTAEDAAAILGNIGHECNGFQTLQETKPVVSGSKGGYGWCQWTGPRRRAYESYCTRNKLDPASDKANYAYLFNELNDSEKKAVPAVKAASGLRAKVIAFEAAFLRAGVKHYDSRSVWAQRALNAYKAAPAPAPAAAPAKPSLIALILGLFRRKAA